MNVLGSGDRINEAGCVLEGIKGFLISREATRSVFEENYPGGWCDK